MSFFEAQYARALADVVLAQKLDTTAIEGQLCDFQETLKNSRELQEILGNPAIPLETKLKVLDAIAPRIGMVPQVRNFVAVILQNDRIHALDAIAREYRKEMKLRLHIQEAVVSSVRELSSEEKARIEAKASELAGVKVSAVFRRDPALLGGVLLRIGDKVYDGSLRGRLEELREKLIAS